MNRRTLFGRLLAGAAAFVVAPAVTVEAAPSAEPALLDAASWSAGWDAAESLAYRRGFADAQDATAEARAEGYERGRAIEQAKQESRTWITYSSGTPVVRETFIFPLTFEAMQADCERRGCALTQNDLTFDIYHTAPNPERPGTSETYIFVTYPSDADPERVNTWRGRLHEIRG